MRARHVERLDSAGRAEGVLRGARVERVSRQRISAFRDAKAIGRDDEMQESMSRTHGAVAVVDDELGGCVDLEADAPAVAATRVRDHRSFLVIQGVRNMNARPNSMYPPRSGL